MATRGISAPEGTKVGRPSLYSEAYCNEVISFMSDGYSLTAFAGEIGVSRETIYQWKSVHPKFADALTKGHAKRMQWWEKRLQTLADSGTGNAAAIIFALKNLSPDDWRDKHEISQSSTVKHVHTIDEKALERMMERLGIDGFADFTESLGTIVSKPNLLPEPQN